MQTIDVESTTTSNNALQVRPEQQAMASAMSVDELHESLAFIRAVMQREMREGQDYGKIPGTGDRPTLLQPGAQKLLMTFRLTEEVKSEKIVDLPNYHREVRYIIAVKSPNGRSWDGVGTCTTLESKYRYRKAERKCPACGRMTIITGKAEYGGGFICFKKKGGCGEKFAQDDQRIISQPAGVTEYENPPDYYNTVSKMAFKRALVHASINATNTSELWTQDLEDQPEAPERPQQPAPPKMPQDAPAPHGCQTPPQSVPTPEKPVSAPARPRLATDATRNWMIGQLNAGKDQESRQITTEYFQAIGQLLPTESIEDLPLRFVPIDKGELARLAECVGHFECGDPAQKAFEPHSEAALGSSHSQVAATPEVPAPSQSLVVAPSSSPAPLAEADEWYMKVVVPIPRKGMKRDQYLKNPDTIGSLFAAIHQGDEVARKRLWGFAHHYEPKGWTKTSGEVMPPSQTDVKFREALDAFLARHQHHEPEPEYQEEAAYAE